jgi:hypothetical protein
MLGLPAAECGAVSPSAGPLKQTHLQISTQHITTQQILSEQCNSAVFSGSENQTLSGSDIL